MQYIRIYQDFIRDRREKGRPSGYSEKHHIVPKSLGGTDDKENLIRLSARDHYFAHCCLAKIYGGKMWQALLLMGQTQKTRHGAEAFNKGRMFAIARKEASDVRSNFMKEAWLSNSPIRRKNYGKQSEQERQKRSNSLKGRTLSQESIQKAIQTKQEKAQKYVFVRVDCGTHFEGTAKDFQCHTGIIQSYVSLLTTGKVLYAKGWVLKGNENKPRGNRDLTIRIFKHKDGQIFEGTAYDFNKLYIKDSGMLSNCINAKNGVKSARGWVYVGVK